MKKYYAYFSEAWFALTVSLITLTAREVAKNGTVSAYVNLNYFLILWLISAILVLYSKPK